MQMYFLTFGNNSFIPYPSPHPISKIFFLQAQQLFYMQSNAFEKLHFLRHLPHYFFRPFVLLTLFKDNTKDLTPKVLGNDQSALPPTIY